MKTEGKVGLPATERLPATEPKELPTLDQDPKHHRLAHPHSGESYNPQALWGPNPPANRDFTSKNLLAIPPGIHGLF